MKSLFISIAAIFLVSASMMSHARDIPRGSLEISGDMDLSIMSSKFKTKSGGFIDTADIDTTTFSVSGLYYVADNVGIGFLWDYESDEITSVGERAKSTTNLVGPAAGFNISLNDKASVMLMASFQIASVDYNDSFFGSESGDGFGFSFGGGMKYFFNDHVALYGAIEYGFMSIDVDQTNETLEISGVSVGVGFSVYIK